MPKVELKPCPFLYDEADAALVEAHRWHIKKSINTSYVARSESSPRRCIYLHREIMKAAAGDEIDHINGNGLDNRRANLRFVTHAENLANNKQKPGVSGYRGVWRSHKGAKWVAVIKRNGSRRYLGVFTTPELAHEAWREAAASNRRAQPESAKEKP